jgi:hypothetical protein
MTRNQPGGEYGAGARQNRPIGVESPGAGCRRHDHDFPAHAILTGQPPGERRSMLPGTGWTCCAGVIAMTTSAAGKSAPSAGAGKAGGVRNLGRWLTRWWFQAPGGGTYQRRQADELVAAAGLGVLFVSGVLVANRLGAGTDVAVFRQINHWPGWLYPPMWTVQLSGVIGALPLVAAAAGLLGRLRLAAALAAAALLKVSLEAAAKMVVQRDRPAETLHDVILRGKAAAHGLSFPRVTPW